MHGTVPVGMLVALALALCVLAAPASASETAPDPGGSESANLRLPPPGGKLFGANGTFDIPGTTAGAIVGRLATSGMNAVRRSLSWSDVEPSQGVWDEAAWASAESFYDSALAHGMTPIFGLAFAPPWARDFPHGLCGSGSCAFPPSRSRIGNWERFVAQAAYRFPRATLELWNEPNSPVFWKPAPDARRWAALVVSGYRAIKRVSPRTRVIICGCAGTIVGAKPEHGVPAHEFLDRAYDASPSIKGHYDGISFHFFPQAYGRNPFKFGSGSPLAKILQSIRTVIADRDGGRVPLWVDEVGYWTKDLRPYVGRPVSEQSAARGLSRFARRLLTNRDIKAVLIHREIDGSGGLDRYAIRDSSFGLLRRRPLLEPKAPACLFAAMAGHYSAAGCPKLRPPKTRIEMERGRDRAVTFQLSSAGPKARFECKLRGRRWRPCRKRVKTGQLRRGRHVFRARAYRADGTQDETPARQAFRIK